MVTIHTILEVLRDCASGFGIIMLVIGTALVMVGIWKKQDLQADPRNLRDKKLFIKGMLTIAIGVAGMVVYMLFEILWWLTR